MHCAMCQLKKQIKMCWKGLKLDDLKAFLNGSPTTQDRDSINNDLIEPVCCMGLDLYLEEEYQGVAILIFIKE